MIVETLLKRTVPDRSEARLVQDVARRWEGKNRKREVADVVRIMRLAGWIEDGPDGLALAPGVQDKPLTEALALVRRLSERR